LSFTLLLMTLASVVLCRARTRRRRDPRP
jgi:hypothetical protein